MSSAAELTPDDVGEPAESGAVADDEELEFEVALASSVDRAVNAYKAKREGWREFTDFEAMLPESVRRTA